MAETLSMRQRYAGQSVIEKLVRHQADMPRRSPLARLLGRSPLNADATAWHLDAQAEITMGRILDMLPAEWTVLHALPAGMGALDIDHLVIGPSGVFTVNTKHHHDKLVWVAKSALVIDGEAFGYIPAAEFEAQRVSAIVEERMLLPTPVQPVVAFIDPKKVTIRERPDQVKVVDAWQLRRWLTNLAPVLSPTEQREIVSVLDDPVTWHATGSESSPSDASSSPQSTSSMGLQAAFDLIDAEVRSAHARRGFWKLVGYGALLIGPLVALPVVLSLLG
ncbi:MAG: nuclease-related domain-containing protein [Leifsonia sp.]